MCKHCQKHCATVEKTELQDPTDYTIFKANQTFSAEEHEKTF